MKIREWIEDTLWAVSNCFTFRTQNYNDNIDRLAFFEEINSGWYQMYIYPYDDPYYPTISSERRLLLAEEPEKIYLSVQDFDALVEKLNQPPDPAVTERLKQLMSKKAPWE